MDEHLRDVVGTILMFIILFGIFLIIYNQEIYKNDSSTLRGRQFKSMLDNKTEIEYLFIGSSHTEKGIDISQFNNSINLGQGGLKDYNILSHIFQKYEEEGKLKYKNIVIEVDPLIFSIKKDRYREAVLFYRPMMSTLQLCKLSGIRACLLSYLPLGRGVSIIKEIFFNEWNKKLKRINNDAACMNKVNTNFGNKFIPYNKSFEYLKRIVELSCKNNSTIILINYPRDYYYLKYLDRCCGYEKEKYIHDVVSTLNKTTCRVYYFNYTYLFSQKSDLHYFLDCDHLNEEGSKTLTSILIKDIYKLKQNN